MGWVGHCNDIDNFIAKFINMTIISTGRQSIWQLLFIMCILHPKCVYATLVGYFGVPAKKKIRYMHIKFILPINEMFTRF